MKKRIIVGNWKMNPPTLTEAKHICSAIKRIAATNPKVSVVICPPALYLYELGQASKKSRLSIGAQDFFYEESGAYTGEISATLVKNSGATYALVGHSERRRLGDSDVIIAKKVLAGLRAGLTVILCIGESARDDHGVYLAFIHDQLTSALGRVNTKMMSKLIIAYEPIWAIGQSLREAITPRHLHEMIIYIRKVLSDRYGAEVGSAVPVLYGGSVFPKNAKAFLDEGMAGGLLVGRESLVPDDFREIVKVAA